jgi:hypothetical protein
MKFSIDRSEPTTGEAAEDIAYLAVPTSPAA